MYSYYTKSTCIIIIDMQNTPVQALNIKVKYIATLISTNSIKVINEKVCLIIGGVVAPA